MRSVAAPLVWAAALACAPVEAPPPLPAARHPVLILDIDTLRADHLGAYGYARDTSPRIDALARQSVVFDWAFAQAPNTPPSQGSILTGLYPRRHGLIEDEDRLREEAVTLAEAMAGAGLTTAAWVDGGYMSAHFGVAQGFSSYVNQRGRGLDAIGPQVLEWLEDHALEDFFLLVHTYDVHTPYSPSPTHRDLFLDGLRSPSPGFEPTVEHLEAVRRAAWSDPGAALPPHDLEYAKALYDAEIREVDDWVGRLLDALDRLGLDERATVVLLSDHGEEFQEHGSVLHEKLYSTVTRIPLIVRLPGGQRAGRVDAVVEAIDIMPTLLELVGAPIPAGLDGTSLLPLILGTGESDGEAWSESPFFGRRRALVHGDQRLLFTLDRRVAELFAFRRDPHELLDRAASDSETVRRITMRLAGRERELARAAAAAVETDAGPESAAVRRDLEALGYITSGDPP